MRVLVVEDDPNLREGLLEILQNEGYETLGACDGEEALALFRSQQPDFICLDIMMPKKSGYDVCREIRKADAGIPIVFISAKSEEIDKVLGLELGADDFIMKPFGVREVVARIRAVARRCLAAQSKKADTVGFRMGDLHIFPDELRARKGGRSIDLSLREVRMLTLLQEQRNKAVGRDAFFDRCWGLDYMPNSRTLDQHIAQLRKKVEEDPKNPVLIRTVHGVGYRYEE